MSQNLPAWFWSHCVKDEATVKKLATQISISDRDQAASQAGYDIKSCIYARLTDYLFGAGWNITGKDQPQKLVHNELFLRLPDDNDSGDGFFVSVAAKLAAHFRTKLIAFDYQDIQDLAEHMVGPQITYSYDVSQHYMSTYFPAADETKFEKWMPDTTAKKWEMLTSFTSDFSKRKTYDSADLFRGMLSNVGNESAIIIILRSREFGRFWHPWINNPHLMQTGHILSQLSGILKREAGGALIYGPPGTGKTHLARIIAKQTSSTMIRVTPADINSKWHGESENNVKSLFKAPWRQDVTNSFLNEVGGFANDPKSPLLILATNFPNNVDTAVLRRVPNKIFIGFPTRSGRQNIFRICLREEKLGKDVELEALAARSSRFTGSDIGFVCHQAASAALEDVVQSSAPIEMPICLEMKHFIRAMKVASPSSDLAMMKDMKFFASQFDQPSLARMNKSGEE
ncbi:hypothetical protein V2G26_019113 [Clonostachys chloroleuca]